MISTLDNAGVGRQVLGGSLVLWLFGWAPRPSPLSRSVFHRGVAADRMLVVSLGEESPACFEEHVGC